MQTQINTNTYDEYSCLHNTIYSRYAVHNKYGNITSNKNYSHVNMRYHLLLMCLDDNDYQ